MVSKFTHPVSEEQAWAQIRNLATEVLDIANSSLAILGNSNNSQFVECGGYYRRSVSPTSSTCFAKTPRHRASTGQSEDYQQSLMYPLQGDRVDVTEPPALQRYKPGFWGEFTHTWTLRNVGSVDWTGRTLVCTNPTDPRIRPVGTTQITIPDSPPATAKFIKISCTFKAQGYEGPASSQWVMQNADGENCFPHQSGVFNVSATVVNPYLHSTTQAFPQPVKEKQ